MIVDYLGDGENIRERLSKLQDRLKDLGLGKLIRIKDALYYTIIMYEHPTARDFIVEGIDPDSPDYQTVKPAFEQTLNKIYEELDRRDSFH